MPNANNGSVSIENPNNTEMIGTRKTSTIPIRINPYSTFPRYTDHAGIGAVANPLKVPVSDSERKMGAKPNIPVKNMITQRSALPTPPETTANEKAITAIRAKRNIENISNFFRN